MPVAGSEHRFIVVDVGNPHAITFEAYDDAAVDRIGPIAATLPPGGTNVEFCVARPDRISVVVWERGVGRTLACGTGACAVAFAACETGRAAYGAPIRVALPGGELAITVAPVHEGASPATQAGSQASGTPPSPPRAQRILMRGPARRVFSGEVTVA